MMAFDDYKNAILSRVAAARKRDAENEREAAAARDAALAAAGDYVHGLDLVADDAAHG